MDQPLVSVVVPAYNHEKYIQETINSIINQTYHNIELLITDDGSTDSTWQKIQEMKSKCEERFTRVLMTKKENEGTCKTLNKLVREAKGEYFFSIASDDIAKPEIIEKEVQFLNNNPEYSLVACNNEIIDSEGNICYWDKRRNIVYDVKKARSKTFVEYLKRHNNFFNDKEFGTYKTLFRGNYIPNGFLVRKSIYDIIGLYPEGGYLEDWWFVLQLSKYSKMKYLDEILFSYRWHESNTIKVTKKIRGLQHKTLKLENQILEKIDLSKVNPDVPEVIEHGVLYKTQGIPYIFQIIAYKKGMYKIKTLKIFNIKFFTLKKEC